MVVIARPSACAVGTRQAQTCSPSSSTVQAPQSPASQPIFVPVRRSRSRSVSASEAKGRAWTVRRSPLTRRVKVRGRHAAIPLRPGRRPGEIGEAVGDERARRRHAVGAARPHVVDRGKAGQVPRRDQARGFGARDADEFGFQRGQAPRHRRAGPDRDARRDDAARRVRLDRRRDHGDGDHEVAPCAELDEVAAAAALRDQDGRHDVPRAAGGRAVAGEERARGQAGGRRAARSRRRRRARGGSGCRPPRARRCRRCRRSCRGSAPAPRRSAARRASARRRAAAVRPAPVRSRWRGRRCGCGRPGPRCRAAPRCPRCPARPHAPGRPRRAGSRARGRCPCRRR